MGVLAFNNKIFSLVRLMGLDNDIPGQIVIHRERLIFELRRHMC
jgi:hypothetical protein